MQNFTFGRKGTNWFLFAFLLLIGTLPSFGQECPIVGDDDTSETGNQQIFCDSQEAEISDLNATPANGSDVVWYETADSSDPIPETQLLVDGNTYYAGNSNDTCNSRESVTVTIINEPEILGIDSSRMQTNKQSLGGLTICVDDINNPETTVGDLRTDADDIPNLTVNWYYNRTDSDPIDPSTPLQDNTDYYASVTNDFTGCETNRARTRVNLESEPAPSGDNEQSFCASNNPTLSDIVASGENRYFPTQNSLVELSQNTPLEDGETYYITAVGEFCESTERLAVNVTLESPSAGEDAVVSFNRGDGIVNLIDYINGTPDAGGTWEPGNEDGSFDTATGEAGEYTYTVTIGECEATATLTVTFDDCPVVEETEQAFCELQTDPDGNNPRIAQVRDLSPSDAFWYAETTSTEVLDPMTELVNGEDYFAGNEDGTCINPEAVTVSIDESPSAGAATIISVCEDAAAFDVVPLINNAVQGPAEAGGTFVPAFASGTTVFDPAVDTARRYTYNVASQNGGCEDDFTFVTIRIEENPNAGDDESLELCQSELDAIIELAIINPEAAQALLLENVGDRDLDGEFNYQNILSQYLAGQQAGYPISIQAEYTVTNSYENAYPEGDEGTLQCEDTATLNLTIIESPYAGDDTSREVSREDDQLDLYQVLVEDSENTPDTGGNWSSGDGTFDPATDVSGTFTYTVTNENCSDSATVTIIVQDEEECPIVEETTQSFCELQTDPDGNNPRRAQIRDLTPNGATWYASEDSEEPLATNSLLIDGETYYAGNAAGECESRTPVFVNIDEAPSAGAVTIINVCETDEPFDVIPLLNEAVQGPAQAGGTFVPAFASETTVFDPAIDTARRYTYNVASENGGCEDDFTFVTINITPAEDANAGPGVQAEYCSNEGIVDLYSLIPEGTTTNGTFDGYENGDFDTAQNLGNTEITYIVSPESGCFNGVAEATYTITVNEAPNAGEDVNLDYCITEIQDMTETEVLEIFTSLLDNRDTGGLFPEGQTPMDLYADFITNPIGTFATTYTVSNENCSDSAELSITINDTEDADAGSDVGNIIVCSTDADVNLFNFLSEDALQNGYFEELDSGIFSPSSNGEGTYTFTFTVDPSSDCVSGSDSAIYTVEVLQGPDAGENGSVEFSREDNPVNLFTYLNGTPDEGGVWNPGNTDGSFNPATDAAGTYTYTVTNENDCSDSATVSVTFTDEPIEECPVVTETEQTFCSVVSDTDGNNPRRPNVSDLMPMNAIWYATADSDEALAPTTQLIDGETYFAGNTEGNCRERNSVVVTIEDSPSAGATTIYEVCQNGEPFDIVDIMNPSTEGPAEAGGVVTPAFASGTTIFDPSVDTARRYTYTVASNGDTCPDDSAFITINFTDSAFAGSDGEVNVCTNAGQQDLFNFIDADADMDGVFTLDGEIITDGIMDPSSFEAGTYEVIYTVTAGEDAECGGDDTATITITLGEAPEAPTTGDAVAFCAIDGATAALLDAEGTNLTWYSDADLSMMVNEEDLLVNGEYYVTQTADNGCESEAAMIMVNIVDSPAPTISSDYELCAFDNPTLADLTAEINETGEVTWYESADSMTALSNNAMLTDGTTYYATLISDNGCESSERLAVTVTLEDCALLFPEAITPNGDGRNDRLVIENIESEYPNYNITIFNRWGNAVYKGNASTPTWDGTSNQSGSLGDDVLPVGVYFYVVDFNDGSTEPRQGKVYLNR